MPLYEADARIAVAAGVDVYKAVYFRSHYSSVIIAVRSRSEDL